MRTKTWAAVSVLGAGVIVGTVLASQSGAAPSPPGTTTTLHVQELNRNETYVPVGSLIGKSPQSAHQGDYVTFADPLVTPGTTHVIGRVSGSCLLTRPKAQIFYCSVDYLIAGKGQINAVGPFNATGKSTNGTVNGGTSTYQHASGTVTIKALNQNRNDFVLTFTT